jgi:hypothetical protein
MYVGEREARAGYGEPVGLEIADEVDPVLRPQLREVLDLVDLVARKPLDRLERAGRVLRATLRHGRQSYMA